MDAAAEGVEEVLTNYSQIMVYLSNRAPEVSPVEDDRMDCIVSQVISLLPTPFVPAPDCDDDHFSLTSSDSEDAAAAADRHAIQVGDGQDHISHLPDDLLSNIVSRLPTKEAARTMVLSARWRCVWAATPLLLDDAHLRAVGLGNFNAVRAISRCVAAHPGPVRAVRITRTSFHRQDYALERLVASLADKNIQDLILLNHPWPLDMPLPDNILSCTSLSRLYIGVWRWRFPDSTPHRPAFPNLHELGLFHSIIEDREVDALLAHCPKLEILSFAMVYAPPPPICISSDNYIIFGRAGGSPSRFRVRSRSLRIVVEWICSFNEIVAEDVPCLERLLFESSYDRRPIKIIHAPRLVVLGFLDLSLHVLEIGGIVIRAGMNVRASAMLPSLKILAVKVRLSHDMEVKMLHTLLRCFPRLQAFHVMSIRSSSLDNVDCAEFWESLGSCDCLKSYLKTFILHRFQGLHREYMLLDYILKNGKVLKTLGIVCSDSDDVLEEVLMSGSVGVGNAPSGGNSASNDVLVERGPISGSVGEGGVSSGGNSGSHDVPMEGGPMSGSCGEGDSPGGSSSNIIYICPASPCWSFQNAIDLSVEDPFCVLRHDKARMASRVVA